MYAPNPGAVDFATEVIYILLLNPLLMVSVFDAIWQYEHICMLFNDMKIR